MGYKDKQDKNGYLLSDRDSTPLMVITLYLDEIIEEAAYKTKDGRRYITLNVVQSRKKKGGVFLSQTINLDLLEKLKDKDGNYPNNIPGTGHKYKSADYWVKEYLTGHYLDFLFEQFPPVEK